MLMAVSALRRFAPGRQDSWKRLPSAVTAFGAVLASALLLTVSESSNGLMLMLRWIAFAPWLAVLTGLSRLGAVVASVVLGLLYIAPTRWSTFEAAIAGTGLQELELMAATLGFFATYALPFVVFALVDPMRHRFASPRSVHGPALFRAGTLATLISVCWTPFPYTPATALVNHLGLAQWASVGGEPLLLLALIWPSALLAALCKRPMPWAGSVKIMMWPLLVLLMAEAAGRYRVHTMDAAESAGAGLRLSALAVQLDLPVAASPLLLMRDKPGAALSALELTRQGYRNAPQCELAVWPETTLPLERNALVCARAKAIALSTGKPFLMQCQQGTGGHQLLTAQWWSADGRESRQHAKSVLVPGYETPLFVSGGLTPGSPGAVFPLDRERGVIPTLCYELYSDAHLRSSVLQGGRFIAFMSSFNAFAGQPIERWNQPMAQLRAIAFGVPILRAGNRANTGWIDANGRIRTLEQRGQPQANCQRLWSPGGRPTLFTWLAPIAAWLPLLVVSIGVTCVASIRRRIRNR